MNKRPNNSYSLNRSYYEGLGKRNDYRFYGSAFPISLFEKNNLTLKDESKNEFKVFNYELFYLLQETNLSVNHEGKDITISGGMFFQDYMEGYQRGKQYFIDNYKLSNDAIYGNPGQELAKRLAAKFVHNGKAQTQGWDYVFKARPVIISHKLMSEYGFYSGLVCELQSLLNAHETLTEQFKAEMNRFSEPSYEISITHDNDGLSLKLYRHESLLERLNGWFKQNYSGELITKVFGFSAWLYELRYNESRTQQILQWRLKLKTMSRAELYQSYFSEKLIEENNNRLSGSHLNDKEYAGILLKQEEANLEDFSQLREYISDFDELESICSEFKQWLESLSGEQGDKHQTKLTLRQIALKYVYSGLQITRSNGDDIAEEHGHSSGERLFQHFTTYSSKANRKGRPYPFTQKRLKNKIALLESVIELLPEDKRSLALDEVQILKSIEETEYQ